ncbi:MAG: GTPase ObgE [Candidatus Marinimicrobia bacterium]|nr:GTPase ObgE [Candidatus Neomarinimicrobiota bacterium]
MNFVDYTELTIQSGNGGPGSVSFLREKFRPRGGPDGGDGGKGGNVIFLADPQLHTLHDVRYHKIYKASNGQPGTGKNRSGKNGEDITIRVPAGTVIFDNKKNIICDMTEEYQLYIAAEGGIGGRGNQHYATSINQIPRYAQEGRKGIAHKLQLELKILADVGLVGFPNAGKSTLLSVISKARPKIADYPFTTLVPNLGIIKYGDYSSFLMADIPGLIKGAHEGKGLGDQFLRHIERTRVLLYLIDVNDEDPVEQFHILRNELMSYNKKLEDKEYFICITKCDTVEDIPEIVDVLIPKEKCLNISSVTRLNLDRLINSITKILS